MSGILATFSGIGFLNDLFYGRSYIAAPAESSIPFLLDEKSTVVPVRLAGEQSGDKRKREWARGSDQRKVFRLTGLFGLCGFSKLADFQQAHRQWIEIPLRDELAVRDARWSEAVAVGNLNFVEKMKSEKRGPHREVISRFKRRLGRNPKSI